MQFLTTQSMPSNVRLFLWLNVAATLVWLAQYPWGWHWPPAMGWLFALYFLWRALILGLAWGAAFYRANWARWLFAILLVLSFLPPFADAWFNGFLISFLRETLSDLAAAPQHFIVSFLLIAATAFVFSGNARTWFRRQPGS